MFEVSGVLELVDALGGAIARARAPRLASCDTLPGALEPSVLGHAVGAAHAQGDGA